MSGTESMEVSITGARYANAAAVYAAKPWLTNVRQQGRYWLGDENGVTYIVGLVPDELLIQQGNGSGGIANYALTKQGDYYGSNSVPENLNRSFRGLFGVNLPGFGDWGLTMDKRWLWALLALGVVGVVLVARKGRR